VADRALFLAILKEIAEGIRGQKQPAGNNLRFA
jgi:hypothetical protein